MNVADLLGKRHGIRRQWVLAQAKFKARMVNAHLRLEVDPSVRFGKNVDFQLTSGTKNVIRLGPRCRIYEGVVFQMKGGTIDFGPNVEVRRNTTFNISGTLSCAGDNIFSYANVVHLCVRNNDRKIFVNQRICFDNRLHAPPRRRHRPSSTRTPLPGRYISDKTAGSATKRRF